MLGVRSGRRPGTELCALERFGPWRRQDEHRKSERRGGGAPERAGQWMKGNVKQDEYETPQRTSVWLRLGSSLCSRRKEEAEGGRWGAGSGAGFVYEAASFSWHFPFYPSNTMCLRGHGITCVVFLAKIYNLNLIIKKHQTNPNWGTLWKKKKKNWYIIFKSVKVKKKAKELFQMKGN